MSTELDDALFNMRLSDAENAALKAENAALREEIEAHKMAAHTQRTTALIVANGLRKEIAMFERLAKAVTVTLEVRNREVAELVEELRRQWRVAHEETCWIEECNTTSAICRWPKPKILEGK